MKKIVIILVTLLISGALFAGTNAVVSSNAAPAKTGVKASKKVVKKTVIKKTRKTTKVVKTEGATNK